MKQKVKIDGKEYTPITKRNVMHFEVQKNARVHIQKSKKIYDRKKLKRIEW